MIRKILIQMTQNVLTLLSDAPAAPAPVLSSHVIKSGDLAQARRYLVNAATVAETLQNTLLLSMTILAQHEIDTQRLEKVSRGVKVLEDVLAEEIEKLPPR